MTPAVRIHQDGRGNWSAHPVTLRYSSPAGLDVALDKVARGRTVFVQPEDAAAVQDAAAAIDSLEHGAEQVFVREGDAEKVRAWVKGQGETPYALGSSE